MKYKTTIVLFVMVLVFGLVIWLVERMPSADHPIGDLVCQDAQWDSIHRLIYERDGIRVECTNSVGDWFLASPVRGRAGADAIERIIAEIASMRRGTIVTKEQLEARNLSYADYGLDPARATIRFHDGSGWWELLIGNRAPLGDYLYVRKGDESSVIGTSSSILEALPVTIEPLRDRMVIRGQSERTHRIELKFAGRPFIQMMRRNGRWMIQQPIVARADTEKIMHMLDVLYSLQVKRFVWDPELKDDGATAPELDPQDVAGRYDLTDESASHITVWSAEDTIGREVILGREVDDNKDTVYAKRHDQDAVYSVDKSIVDLFGVKVNDLRDRDLFDMALRSIRYVSIRERDRKLVLQRDPVSGWMIIEPVKWKGDRESVEKMLSKVLKLQTLAFLDGENADLKSFGLNPPARTIEIGSSLPAEKSDAPEVEPGTGPQVRADSSGELRKLEIGTILREARDTAFARFDGENTILRINADSIRAFGRYIGEPLAYRDRTMLSVPLKHIRSIALISEGKEEFAARSGNTWAGAGSTTNALNLRAVEDILLMVSNLRATRIEVDRPGSLEDYGLDKGVLTLRLGLSEEEGIQKSLIIGAEAGDEGSYAMVQGLDVVFVLDRRLVAYIRRGLTITPGEDREKQLPVRNTTIHPEGS